MSDLFGFFNMIDNYEERKVKNYTLNELNIDTCAVSDSDKPYETGIQHPLYNEGKWIIVELYDTKEEAENGHDKWVKIMTKNKLPEVLKDVNSCFIAKYGDACNRNKEYKKEDKNDSTKNEGNPKQHS